MAFYELSSEAQNDLFEIWMHIAGDSVELADRIYDEFHSLLGSLGKMPGQRYRQKISPNALFCSSLFTRT